MTITINGDKVDIVPEKSLQELLEEKSFAQKKGIAVAVNNKVVPKIQWQSFLLNNNDSILIISATKGG